MNRYDRNGHLIDKEDKLLYDLNCSVCREKAKDADGPVHPCGCGFSHRRSERPMVERFVVRVLLYDYDEISRWKMYDHPVMSEQEGRILLSNIQGMLTKPTATEIMSVTMSWCEDHMWGDCYIERVDGLFKIIEEKIA